MDNTFEQFQQSVLGSLDILHQRVSELSPKSPFVGPHEVIAVLEQTYENKKKIDPRQLNVKPFLKKHGLCFMYSRGRRSNRIGMRSDFEKWLKGEMFKDPTYIPEAFKDEKTKAVATPRLRAKALSV
jgi:hypothetical protein